MTGSRWQVFEGLHEVQGTLRAVDQEKRGRRKVPEEIREWSEADL